MSDRHRGQRRDHIQVGGVAWRAAIWLAGVKQAAACLNGAETSEWLSTDDLASEIDAMPSTLPTRLAVLVDLGVVERRWAPTRAGFGRTIEWRWIG